MMKKEASIGGWIKSIFLAIIITIPMVGFLTWGMSTQTTASWIYASASIFSFIVSMLIFSPKMLTIDQEKLKAQKTGIVGIWKEFEQEVKQVFTVNGIERSLGKKNVDAQGDVYLYISINNKISRSKIIQFTTSLETLQTTQNRFMSSKIETKNKGVSVIKITTEDETILEIKSNVWQGRRLEKEYLELKHS